MNNINTTNTNTTISTRMTTGLNKQYYDRQLLESARTRFVHAQFGQMRPIPRNNGKRVEFRRWNLFDVDEAMTPLTEGVTPASQTLSQSTVEAEVKQYGAYVEVSDMLDLTAFDPVISDSAELLGEQLGTVVEWVTRDAMCAGSNVQYANGKSDRSELTSYDVLTVDEIRKAVRTLKRAKARPFDSDGRQPHFICICSPEATYDLQNDSLWQDVSKYSNAEQIYSGEMGRLFGVVFVESTESKIFNPTFKSTIASATANTIMLSEPLTAEQAKYFNNRLLSSTISIGALENVPVSSYDELSQTITLDTTLDDIPSAGTIVCSCDAGQFGAPVHATLVFGKDAYGVINLEGEGALKTIIKPAGSSGTADPLDQRSTVGAKVSGYTAKILNELWLLRIEHGVSE